MGERVRYALVRADRRSPHVAVAGVIGGFIQRVATDAVAERRPHDSLRVQAHEDLAQALVLRADKVGGRHADVIEE
ncbi:Uncharacterised protein [Mycobacteroides abscessus subsp. abscessus]|nr:Uncharacterised protein [Mycobacteroides abscessus subsp. abscessus]